MKICPFGTEIGWGAVEVVPSPWIHGQSYKKKSVFQLLRVCRTKVVALHRNERRHKSLFRGCMREEKTKKIVSCNFRSAQKQTRGTVSQKSLHSSIHRKNRCVPDNFLVTVHVCCVCECLCLLSVLHLEFVCKLALQIYNMTSAKLVWHISRSSSATTPW